ncbi:protein SOB FIVE-LIKE 5-like isoform X1 [Lotus japonicus]|uniref:protein SOB FIVE-LIKE 5-like isoform X1 n=1 Tax=Lotus japonicus TaxID=34305 RepID=UPI0025891189|nr:protein SOB FIVE-LIKE 5-like isoform X1 [Lotus japonicus]
MNAFDSDQCSSGCESGWTLYLENEHSFLNQNASHGDTRLTSGFYEGHKEDDNSSGEEDLSMVSDASSGPPHFSHDDGTPCFNEEDTGCFYSAPKVVKLAKSGTKKQRGKKNQHHEDQYLPSFLHDTATSPHFDFSTNNVTGTNQQSSTGSSMMDYSQGSSATYFGGSSYFQEEHFGFIQPSLSENQLQGNNRWKGIGMR